MYDSGGVTYMGAYNRTKRGQSCMNWDSLGKDLVFEPDDELRNYCRNPKYATGGRKGRPWCYVFEKKRPKQRDCRNIIECREYPHLCLTVDSYFAAVTIFLRLVSSLRKYNDRNLESYHIVGCSLF